MNSVADGDWLKLHRGLVDSQVFSDPFVLKLWIWCLCKANWKRGWHLGCEILPGQFATGELSASGELGVSGSKWRRGMSKLKEFGCINTKATNRFTLVTIEKWGLYQSDSEKPTSHRRTSDEPPTSHRRTSDEPPTTIEEGKKGRRKEKIHTQADAEAAASFAQVWDAASMPIGFHQHRDSFELWNGTRRYDGREIPFTPSELRAQAIAITRAGLSDSEAKDCVELAAIRGWKSINVDLWKRERGETNLPNGGPLRSFLSENVLNGSE